MRDGLSGYVFDFYHVPVEAMRALEQRRLLIHNSNFELTMLAAHGVRLRRAFCTLQPGFPRWVECLVT